MGFIKDFKSFLLKGDIINLSVAVVIGSTFGKIVASFTKDILMPPVGLFLNDVNFTELRVILKEEVKNASGEIAQAAVSINYGSFLQSIADFIIIGLCVFLVLKTYENLKKKKEEIPVTPKSPTQEELLTQIRDLLKEK